MIQINLPKHAASTLSEAAIFRLHRVLPLSLLIAALGLAPSAFAADFTNVTYHRCYDGDTCTFTIPDVHPT